MVALDWIKMRTDLAHDPAVILISARTGLSEDEVVGKLHKFWSWADKHTTDGVIAGVGLKWVDRFVGEDEFASAMVTAGWLVEDRSGIIIPKFTRHNGKSAKLRAETARRVSMLRDKCNAKDVTNVTQNGVAREEKNREEKKKEKTAPDPLKFPPVLDTPRFRALWAKWVAYRKEIGHPLKRTTVELQIKKLASWGHDAACEALEQAMEKGYQGFFEPKGDSRGHGPREAIRQPHRVRASEEENRAYEAKTIKLHQAQAASGTEGCPPAEGAEVAQRDRPWAEDGSTLFDIG